MLERLLVQKQWDFPWEDTYKLQDIINTPPASFKVGHQSRIVTISWENETGWLMQNSSKVQWVYHRLLIKRAVIIRPVPCRHAPLQCNFLIPCLKRCLCPHLSRLGHVTCSGYWDIKKHASKKLRSAYGPLVACLLLTAARILRPWHKPGQASLLSQEEENQAALLEDFQPPVGEWDPLDHPEWSRFQMTAVLQVKAHVRLGEGPSWGQSKSLICRIRANITVMVLRH